MSPLRTTDPITVRRLAFGPDNFIFRPGARRVLLAVAAATAVLTPCVSMAAVVRSPGTTWIGDRVGIEAVGDWMFERRILQRSGMAPSFTISPISGVTVLGQTGGGEALTITSGADGGLVGGTIMTREGISVNVCGLAWPDPARPTRPASRNVLAVVVQYN